VGVLFVPTILKYFNTLQQSALSELQHYVSINLVYITFCIVTRAFI